jgi:hypothetical protein
VEETDDDLADLREVTLEGGLGGSVGKAGFEADSEVGWDGEEFAARRERLCQRRLGKGERKETVDALHRDVFPRKRRTSDIEVVPELDVDGRNSLLIHLTS